MFHLLYEHEIGEVVTAQAADRGPEPAPNPSAPQASDGEGFPVCALPEPLRSFVELQAQQKGCPPEFVAVPALVAAATAIGNTRALRVSGDWMEAPRIYAAVVARSGAGKTPAQTAALHPLEQRQLAEHTRYRQTASTYEAELETYKRARASWEEEYEAFQAGLGPNPGEAPQEPEAPVFRQVLLKDATLEAVAVALQQNPRGILLTRNELGAWLRGMNQYRNGRGADRETWMEFWDGSPYPVNRKTHPEPLIIPRPFVNVLGALTPDDVDALVRRGNPEDGFIQRFLIAFPKDVEFLPEPREVPGADTASEAYANLLGGLFELDAATDEDGLLVPRVVSWQPSSKDIYDAWYQDHRMEANCADFPEYLISPWSKIRGYCLRLTLIVHMCRYVSGEVAAQDVDAESVDRGVHLAEYFKRQARRVYGYLHAPEEDRQFARFRDWVKRHGGTVTVRQAQRANVAGVRTKDEAVRLFRLAAERGLGAVETSGSSTTFIMKER